MASASSERRHSLPQEKTAPVAVGAVFHARWWKKPSIQFRKIFEENRIHGRNLGIDNLCDDLSVAGDENLFLCKRIRFLL
jgi:hypothetical protein